MRCRLSPLSVLVIALVAMAPGCRSTTAPEREMERNRELWQSQNATNYDVTMATSCFCPQEATQPLRVQVRNNVVVAANSVATGAAVDLNYARTIDQIFDTIEGTLSQGKVMLAVYDAEFGYPRQLNLDRITNAIDDEVAFELSALDIKR
jgi:hypothetical protein